MRLPLLLASTMVLAACSAPDSPTGAGHATNAAAGSAGQATIAAPRHKVRAIAALPDRGRLLAYAPAAPIANTAYRWHEVALSEAHALAAVVDGTLELEAPDGTPIRLAYARHVEHPDGNWTWVGRPAGAAPGTEAIITFGEKAVFGTVPNGKGPPLRITSARGKTWVVETDAAAIARMGANGDLPRGPDFKLPPALAAARDKATTQAAAAPVKLTASGAAPESNTVDVVIGYTNTFASRLGGTSQAQTRLNFIVDVANQAFINSQVVAAVRLVGTVALNYPDATDNGDELEALTGVACPDDTGPCTIAPVPAALQPLVNLRNAQHADLMSLVRNFNEPENDSCGIAWLIGGGQEPILNEDSYAGVSVVSDSNGVGGPFGDDGYYCRDETFAHEIAHNMGAGHDVETSRGSDGVLSADEYGRFPYSFGYRTSTFYTVMAYGQEIPGQRQARVFSTPRLSAPCFGTPCGLVDQADNARGLGQTVPIIAAFFATVNGGERHADFNADGLADIVWRNLSSGANQIWRSANVATKQAVATVPAAWTIVGNGDFDGDARSDLVWRNTSTGANAIWRAGSSASATALTTVADQNWRIVGLGDYDGDGLSDLLWRNEASGVNQIWRSANSAAKISMSPIAGSAWKVAGTGDFDGDGHDDVLWRNGTSGANRVWRSGNASAQIAIADVPNTAWRVAGVGDFNADGRDDILWRNASTGANVIWRSASNATQVPTSTTGVAWTVAAVADYNGDRRADVLWRNTSTGANIIWRSANSATTQAVASVSPGAWTVRN